jgi:hypothetical protein
MATGFAAWTNQFGVGLSLKEGYSRLGGMQVYFQVYFWPFLAYFIVNFPTLRPKFTPVAG